MSGDHQTMASWCCPPHSSLMLIKGQGQGLLVLPPPLALDHQGLGCLMHPFAFSPPLLR